ncbi:MAG TPA: hypothetical protein VH170_00215 [Chthoniobacterales bacterium]|nr:hypothetical protein [Chthoniobacterales bacterium]
MNLPDSWTWAELRHKFVLTPEEKRVIAFVILALLLGLGTKFYRDTHSPQSVRIEKKHSISHRRHDDSSPKRD